MISLLRTEFSRFRHRRSVALLVLAAVVLPAIIWATTAWGSRPVSAEELAKETQAVQSQIQDTIDQCIAAPADWGLDPDSPANEINAACTSQNSYDVYIRDELDLGQLVSGDGTAFGLIMLLTALFFAAGASFAGADWASGSMSNQLLMETRRTRVWSAKALVVGAVSLVVSAAVLAVFWGLMVLLAKVWDRPAVPDIAATLTWFNLRGLVLITLAGVAGFAMAMWLRSTSGALAIVFGVAFGAELALNSLPIDNPQPWTPSLNIAAWVNNGATYWSRTCMSSDCTGEVPYSLSSAAVYLLVLLVLAVACSLRSFARRDVP